MSWFFKIKFFDDAVKLAFKSGQAAAYSDAARYVRLIPDPALASRLAIKAASLDAEVAKGEV